MYMRYANEVHNLHMITDFPIMSLEVITICNLMGLLENFIDFVHF